MARSPALPGFNTPAVGFEQPFAMLEACHERVQRTLGLLERLQAHVAQSGPDEAACQAAADVLRYFDVAAPLHHQDEELHVFPLLLAQGPPAVRGLVESLQQDHLAMAADWAQAREPLVRLLDRQPTAFSAQDCAVFSRFTARYAAHMEREENLAYPAAQAVATPEALQAMGQEMAERRRHSPGVPRVR